jgi:hypothetical protein
MKRKTQTAILWSYTRLPTNETVRIRMRLVEKHPEQSFMMAFEQKMSV